MEIVIQGDEYQQVLVCAKAKHEVTEKKKASRAWGKYLKGVKNTKEDPCRVERHGTLGELAFCKVNGEEYDFEETYLKYDFTSNGKTIDVKAIEYFELLINAKVGFTADICVLFKVIEDNATDKAVLKLIGWCSKETILSAPIKPAPRNRPWLNYVVPFDKFKPLETKVENANAQQ